MGKEWGSLLDPADLVEYRRLLLRAVRATLGRHRRVAGVQAARQAGRLVDSLGGLLKESTQEALLTRQEA